MGLPSLGNVADNSIGSPLKFSFASRFSVGRLPQPPQFLSSRNKLRRHYGAIFWAGVAEPSRDPTSERSLRNQDLGVVVVVAEEVAAAAAAAAAGEAAGEEVAVVLAGLPFDFLSKVISAVVDNTTDAANITHAAFRHHLTHLTNASLRVVSLIKA
ncbi:hypothetical protein ASE82_06395 [Sphingomonas sp. Leaf230]|nr:hypothetical protein ASE82_06395 [Sphingomonas sp. Leaf230]